MFPNCIACSLSLLALSWAGLTIPVSAGEPPVIPVGLDAYRQWERWPYQRIGARAYMRSTHDRTGGNESADASHFLYQESNTFNVSLDVEGAGVLVFARYNHWHGSPWHYEVDGRDHIVQESSSAADRELAPQSQAHVSTHRLPLRRVRAPRIGRVSYLLSNRLTFAEPSCLNIGSRRGFQIESPRDLRMNITVALKTFAVVPLEQLSTEQRKIAEGTPWTTSTTFWSSTPTVTSTKATSILRAECRKSGVRRRRCV